MKRLYRIILVIFSIFIMPNVVDASVYVSCPNVIVGDTTECVVSSNSIGLETISAKIDVVGGVTMMSISPNSSFAPIENDVSLGTSGFLSYEKKNDLPESFIIAKIIVKAETVGPAAINLTEMEVVEDGITNNLGTKSGSFMVNPKPTQTTTTTTTTQATTTAQVTTTTTAQATTTTTTSTKIPDSTTSSTETTTSQKITLPILEPLKLLNVTVDDFKVFYEKGAYYVTTESNTESVVINAEAQKGISIVGTGVRNLTYGKNVAELILTNSLGQKNSYQVIITRPDDKINYDTKLTYLKVVNYGLAFEPNKLEYTIKVPYNVDEIYVIAETIDNDVNISGAGLKTLTKGNNEIYIKVSYGDLASTTYVINVKRDYHFLFLIIAFCFLGLCLVVVIIYAYINRKAALEARLTKNNHIVNEHNSVGESKNIVIPTNVVNENPPIQTIPIK